MDIFERLESEVRSYSRAWPTVFRSAVGAHLYDEGGREYIDFFSGASTLNYGHNDPEMKRRLIEYLERDGVVHSLDMATEAKRDFLERFDAVILRPRGLDYKVQFPGPTGTNAVEAALKLARKVTGRQTIVAFTNAYHGMTLGALAATANPAKRRGAGLPLSYVVFMPFDGFLGGEVDTTDDLETHLRSAAGSDDAPAAVIVETVQAEGGVNVASFQWLARLAALCRAHDVLLIVDDIQTGCGRTGPFFSFEPAEIRPDIVCLSKSLSGYGLPMAVTLIRRELDIWEPGEHNGTFRGNNAAFVTASEALRYWETHALERSVAKKAAVVHEFLSGLATNYPEARASVRGRGLLQGLHC
ncbi:MAG: diaminobutyrate--2-oxoglutarate transaminase, partial [Dehalococcoidia bacterium]